MKARPLEVKPKYVYWIHSIIVFTQSQCQVLKTCTYTNIKWIFFLLNDGIFMSSTMMFQLIIIFRLVYQDSKRVSEFLEL